MILPITTITLIVSVVAARALGRLRNDRRNGLIVGLTVWAVALSLTALPVLTYVVDYSAEVDLLIAASIGAVTVGYLVVRKPAITPPAEPRTASRDIRLISLIGVAGVVGNVLMLVYVAMQGISLNPVSLLQNLSETRETNFALAASGGASGLIIFGGGTLSPLSAVYLALARLRPHRPLIVANIVLVVLVAFSFYGGRQTILLALGLLVVSAWIRGARLKVGPRTVVIAVVALAGAFYFATSFVNQRQARATDAGEQLRTASHAEYGPLTDWADANSPLTAPVLQYSYFSSPIPAFVAYMETGLVTKPLSGSYSFHIPVSIARLVSGSENVDWATDRAAVLYPFRATGFVPNAWATGLRELVSDFGRIGAVAFLLVFGALMAWARNRYEDTGDAFYHALEAYLTLIFAFSPFQSLFYMQFVAYGLYLLVLVLCVRGFAAPVGERRPRPRVSSRLISSGH